MRKTIAKGFDSLGILYDEKTLDKLEIYAKLLVEWNEKINLTAITEPEEIAVKHFVDCAVLAKEIEGKEKIIDVGTGAGFPGLVLKILKPEIKLCLLDSLNKRIDFLKAVADELELSDVEFVHARAEDGGRDKKLREKFDFAVARAVANLTTLCEYCLPFVKVSGRFLSMKGPDVKDEVENAKNAINKLGGEVSDIKSEILPETDICHTIISINKMRQTPSQYPRKAGKPSKEPLK